MAWPRIRFHDLHPSAVTLPLSQGVPVKVISELPGHSTTPMTLEEKVCATRHTYIIRLGPMPKSKDVS